MHSSEKFQKNEKGDGKHESIEQNEQEDRTSGRKHNFEKQT
jgi:hypothetical protein